jgi:hypothetical protein
MSISAIMNGRVGVALTMLLFFLTMSLLALGFPEKARLMPLLVGVPSTLLAFIQLIHEIRTSPDESGDAEDLKKRNKAERSMFFWIFLFAFGILGFGFTYAGPALVFGFLYFGRKETLSIASISAAATWAVLFGFFEIGFKIPLFTGLVVDWLTG